ncbi:MAG: branched-chain amino acid ABC transporter permease [Gammaproteobacteria bacterium]|nr:branched-chain amino acid ABC transporter permease [Gammaproteobacteria bacterium]
MSEAVPILLFALFAAVLPGFFEGYELYRVTLAGVYAIAIMGLVLLIGLSGQFSIGHSAFFALGAYAMAIGTTEYGINAYGALIIAAMVGIIAGILVGIPARRLGFVHLALVTWGVALAVPQLLKSSYLEAWTRGVQGIYLDRPPPPALLPVSDDVWWYWVTLAVLLGLLVLGLNLSHSRSARALRALKDSPIAAQSLGINAALYKPLIFGVSAGYAAVAGALAALLSDFVAPDAYGVFFSIALLVGTVAGGVASVWGAIPGGLLIQYLPDLASDASAALSLPAYGLILIVLMYMLPDGVVGVARRIYSMWEERR